MSGEGQAGGGIVQPLFVILANAGIQLPFFLPAFSARKIGSRGDAEEEKKNPSFQRKLESPFPLEELGKRN